MLIGVFLVGELDARTESETQPALTHATDTSVRVEIGLARSALPPLQTPTLLWVLLVVSQGLQLLGAAAGRGCRRAASETAGS